MKQYIGTKIIQAKPMNRGEYNKYRGWEIPADENPEDEGYLVKYKDGPQRKRLRKHIENLMDLHLV